MVSWNESPEEEESDDLLLTPTERFAINQHGIHFQGVVIVELTNEVPCIVVDTPELALDFVQFMGWKPDDYDLFPKVMVVQAPTERDVMDAGSLKAVAYEFFQFIDEVSHALHLDGNHSPIAELAARFCVWSHRKG